jgi:hypothetical protein
MLKKDLSRSKIGENSKFMTDPNERTHVFDVLLKNIEKLLDHFMYIIGSKSDTYPVITLHQFSESLKILGVYNENDKSLNSEDIQ